MSKTRKRSRLCTKCGESAGLYIPDWMGKRILCIRCDARLPRNFKLIIPNPVDPAWLERAKQSEERILARYGATN